MIEARQKAKERFEDPKERQKMSDTLKGKFKGENNPMYGKSANKGKHRVYRDDGTFYMSF